jgi:hypothetical protein
MRHTATAFLALCLLSVGLPESTAAQSPEASPGAAAARPIPSGPPSQRIVVPGVGLAVSFPHDWAVDVRTVPFSGDSVLPAPDVEASILVNAYVPGSLDGCRVSLWRSADMAPDELAEWQAGLAGPPVPVTPASLPAGDGYRIDLSTEMAGEPDSAAYVLGLRDDILQLTCLSRDPPEDRWLSIAASLEVVPIEPLRGPAPSRYQTVLPMFTAPFRGAPRLSNHFDHRYPLPFKDGNTYQLTWRGAKDRDPGRIPGHAGYDWLMPKGRPLLAVAAGTVVTAGVDDPFYCPALGRKVRDNRFVEILHPMIDGQQFSSVYVHLSRIDVKVGDSVRQGQPIGLSGNAGCSTEPHLHFQVWRYTDTNTGRPTLVDPYGWQPERPDPWARHRKGTPSAWLWLPGEAPLLKTRR